MIYLEYDHTVGDGDPLIVRLTKNGAPVPVDTADNITMTVTPVNKQAPKYIDAGVCVAMPLLGVGVIKYVWQPADSNIPKGVTEAKFVVTEGGLPKTYPTNRNFNFIINFL